MSLKNAKRETIVEMLQALRLTGEEDLVFMKGYKKYKGCNVQSHLLQFNPV